MKFVLFIYSLFKYYSTLTFVQFNIKAITILK